MTNMDRIIYMLILVLSCQTLKAQTGALTGSGGPRLGLSLSAGYSSEDFNWSIAGNSKGTDPNIYSELCWTDQAGALGEVKILYRLFRKFFVESSLNYKTISSGSVNDSDYEGDNRTVRTFNITLDSKKGSAISSATFLGYKIKLLQTVYTDLQFGYSINKQNLYLADDNNVTSSPLNSSYRTSWTGVASKISVSVNPAKKLVLKAEALYHQANYAAKADWNLIEEFQHPVSFRHKAKGYGAEGSLVIAYTLVRNCSISACGNYFTWKTGKGLDKVYMTNGETPQTQLNQVTRRGYILSTGVSLFF